MRPEQLANTAHFAPNTANRIEWEVQRIAG